MEVLDAANTAAACTELSQLWKLDINYWVSVSPRGFHMPTIKELVEAHKQTLFLTLSSLSNTLLSQFFDS